jgi:hypothetical protein
MSRAASGRLTLWPALLIALGLPGCGGSNATRSQPAAVAAAVQAPVAQTVAAASRRKLRNCFRSPARCGFPTRASTGVANCAALRPSRSVTAATPGQRIENLNVAGTITVAAPGVRINHVCVTSDGGGALGSSAIALSDGATGTIVSNSTIRGADESSHSVEIALDNDYGNAGAIASRVQVYNCGECLHQTWTLTRSYVNANGMRGTGDHFEDWYYSDTTVTASDDTLLNPEMQTAVLFGDTHVGGGGSCANHLTVTGSLLAGGGAMFYPCGNASDAGSSTMTITGNRFARCLTRPSYDPASGGSACAGGRDVHGYFPKGGFFFPAAYVFTGPGQVWRGNVWDDNSRPVSPSR